MHQVPRRISGQHIAPFHPSAEGGHNVWDDEREEPVVGAATYCTPLPRDELKSSMNVDTIPATSTSGILSASQFGVYSGPTSHIPPHKTANDRIDIQTLTMKIVDQSPGIKHSSDKLDLIL